MVDPLTIAVVSGVLSIVYDKHKETKAQQAKNIPPPIKIHPNQVRLFTTARGGVREFDADIVRSSLVAHVLGNLKVATANGPPGCSTLRLTAVDPNDYASRTAQEAIDAGIKQGKVVLVSLSVVLVEPTLYMPGPVAIIIGENNIRGLAGMTGDFAVWNPKQLPIDAPIDAAPIAETPEAQPDTKPDHADDKPAPKAQAQSVSSPITSNGRPANAS